MPPAYAPSFARLPDRAVPVYRRLRLHTATQVRVIAGRAVGGTARPDRFPQGVGVLEVGCREGREGFAGSLAQPALLVVGLGRHAERLVRLERGLTAHQAEAPDRAREPMGQALQRLRRCQQTRAHLLVERPDAGRRVHDIADDPVLDPPLRPPGAEGHFAAVQAEENVHGWMIAKRVESAQRIVDVQPRLQRPAAQLGGRARREPHRLHGVADVVDDHAAVALDRRENRLEVAVHQLQQRRRAQLLAQLGIAFDIAVEAGAEHYSGAVGQGTEVAYELVQRVVWRRDTQQTADRVSFLAHVA